MSRRSLLVRIAGVVVGIVAVALAAATIDNPVEPGGTGGVGGGEGSGQPPATEQPMVDGGGGVEIPAFLEYLIVALLVVVALAVAWYLISHRRDAVKLIAIFLGVGLVILAIVYLFMQLDPGSAINQSPPEMGEMNETPGGGEPGEGDGTTDSVPRPLLTLFVALLVVTSIFVGALVVSSRDSDSVPGSTIETEPNDDDNAAAVAAAAGRAAERIESSGDEDVDNEVYRAWRDMTRLLEVDRPETSTPREFADAATDAGLAREDVDELTRLFEDTRYGHAETTDEMESRAVSVLRRIEDEYALENEGDEADASERSESSERTWGGR
ncbi:DUF4129 domain-containing protein [Halobacteria archaeon AArc-m2/3/4]|uniref:DUF4129 domain-containing protein n=1 Tax=Natronoglomus mannanivorans TaxID=2979990 RepID=A0AAP2YVI1_9EURY|nr:DUF4129 domain-containing protein [Halobacteria archaeon AArc-xg1-1]MCU4971621.1 DUF4129 domain-containing protein [Halobacteria archaeon AArc-m2/3/4]